MSNAFRPGQAITQSVEESVNDTSNQVRALAENAGVNKAVGDVVSQSTNQIQGIQTANPNTAVGSIDVTNPGTGAALGLSPANQAIAARVRSPLSVPKEQYGGLFNR